MDDRSQHVANLLAQMSNLNRNAWRNPDNWDVRCYPTSPKDTPGSTQTSKYATLSKSGLLCPPVGDIGVGPRKPCGNDHK